MSQTKTVSHIRKQLLAILPKSSVVMIYDHFNLTTRKSYWSNISFLREDILLAWEKNSEVGWVVFKELERLAVK